MKLILFTHMFFLNMVATKTVFVYEFLKDTTMTPKYAEKIQPIKICVWFFEYLLRLVLLLGAGFARDERRESHLLIFLTPS